jgi:RimJ/RimL family protein N-acetyltransferase
MKTEIKTVITSNGEVVIREIENSDLQLLAKYANNPKVAINLRDAFPNPYALEDAIRFKEAIDKQNPKTIFAIEFKGEYVGNISLSPGTDVYRKSAEIGYFIGEPFWNMGIMSKAVDLITEWGFKTLDIVRIYTGVFEFNKASQRVLEKCGFSKEAVFRKSICKYDLIYDEIRYAKLKE